MAKLQEDCWVFKEATVSISSVLCVEQKQALHFSDIFCPASGGTESWMLTRELNLHSHEQSNWSWNKDGRRLFLLFLRFRSSNSAIQIVKPIVQWVVLSVLGFWDTSPLLLIIWPIEQLYETVFSAVSKFISALHVWPCYQLGPHCPVTPGLARERHTVIILTAYINGVLAKT